MILKPNPSINIAARIIEYSHFLSRQLVDSAGLAFGNQYRANQNRVNAKPHVTPEAAGAVIPPANAGLRLLKLTECVGQTQCLKFPKRFPFRRTA